MGQGEQSKDDAGGENVGSYGMESWNWELRGALSKSKSRRV